MRGPQEHLGFRVETTVGEAQRAKDEAISRVKNNNAEWVGEAVELIREMAKVSDSFTTDDVWEELAEAGWPVPVERRSMGAAMKEAGKAGYIQATAIHTMSKRRACHRRPVRVWVSRLR